MLRPFRYAVAAFAAGPLGQKYPQAVKVWENARDRFTPFLAFTPGVRKLGADGAQGLIRFQQSAAAGCVPAESIFSRAFPDTLGFAKSRATFSVPTYAL
jgi:hypothetical protein